jgi:uncharacterized protein (TIGR01777 family)
MRIFVTGGTGLIGRRLVPRLAQHGEDVVVLTRSPLEHPFAGIDVSVAEGNPTQPGEWQVSLAACDAVINLAGENLMSARWNDAQKRRIRASRVLATQHVVEAIRRSDGRCTTLVNASAIGYYGDRGDERIDESAGPGSDFLADVCATWEAEATAAAEWGARVVCLRTGVVLDPTGGALEELVRLVRRFLGGPVGSGNQWFSWIHYEDLVGIFCSALVDPDMGGPVNGTSPNPVTNRQFVRGLGRVLRRPSALRMPAWVLRCAIGEAADTVLASQRILPGKMMNRGFQFQYGQLEPALEDLLGRI